MLISSRCVRRPRSVGIASSASSQGTSATKPSSEADAAPRIQAEQNRAGDEAGEHARQPGLENQAVFSGGAPGLEPGEVFR